MLMVMRLFVQTLKAGDLGLTGHRQPWIRCGLVARLLLQRLACLSANWWPNPEVKLEP